MGAATSANQTTANASLASIDSKTPALVSGRQPVDGSGVTQPISAASLPLPTGAATSALQTTGNTSLSSIDSKTPTLGQKTMANSQPVVIASDQTAFPVTISGAITAQSRREHDYYISQGNAFGLISADSALTANSTETNLVYIRNPSLTKSVYIFQMFASDDVAGGNNWIRFKLYYNPTVSANGTLQTVPNLLAGSATASTTLAYYSPTVTTRGTLIRSWSQGFNNAAGPINEPHQDHYLILPPSQTLLFTATAKANGNAINAMFYWFEV